MGAALRGDSEDRSLSLQRGNLLGTLLAVALVVGLNTTWALLLPGPAPLSAMIEGTPLPLIPAVLLALTVAHEALHAATWAVLYQGQSGFHVKFGVQWRYLMPYANPIGCMPAWINRAGGLAPAFVLGFARLAGALWADQPVLAGWAIIMIGSCAGDFLIVWTIRDLAGTVLVEDLPERIGVVVHWAKSQHCSGR